MSGFTVYDKEDSEDVHPNAVEGKKRPRTSMAPFMLFDRDGQVGRLGGWQHFSFLQILDVDVVSWFFSRFFYK